MIVVPPRTNFGIFFWKKSVQVLSFDNFVLYSYFLCTLWFLVNCMSPPRGPWSLCIQSVQVCFFEVGPSSCTPKSWVSHDSCRDLLALVSELTQKLLWILEFLTIQVRDGGSSGGEFDFGRGMHDNSFRWETVGRAEVDLFLEEECTIIHSDERRWVGRRWICFWKRNARQFGQCFLPMGNLITIRVGRIG